MTKQAHETLQDLKKREPTKAEIRRRTPLGASTPIPPQPVVKSATKEVTVRAKAHVVVPDNRDYAERYLDEVAPVSIVGRMIKFGKDGEFFTHDDGAGISEDTDFIALCDETLIGWVKFGGAGEPPERVMGLLYDGFQMPPRSALGDDDPSQWELGLDGQPADPWQHHQYLVLQQADTKELFTFVTSSKTGRRAVVDLLRHFKRMRKESPGDVPVVRLKVGGYQHSDARVGWVKKPIFVLFGQVARNSAMVPDTVPDTSTGGILNDEIPFR